MEITAALVKELREKSGVAMMDCKKALVECDGDLEKAFDLLRSNSALKAEKKAGRVAADGVIKAFACDTYASLVEINTETDFAAKDSSFIDFTNDVEETISNQQFDSIDSLMETGLEEKRKTLVQSIGENIQVRKIETLSFNSANVGLYVHSDSKLAAMAVLEGGDETLAKDIAMHISATNPLCLTSEDVDKEVYERERAIYVSQAEESGKPQEIMDKIIDGKMKRFLSEISLVSQSFIKDPDKTIYQLLNENNAKIVSFIRLKVGEGIEVESKNFADEVAEQLK